MKLFTNGKVIEYNGGRVADEIVTWLKKKTGPPAVDLTSADEASKFKSSQDVVVVAYFSDKESDKAKAFLEVASENNEIAFALTSDKSVAESLEITEEGVVLFKKFDDNRNDFKEELTASNLKTFVAANSLPLVVEFSHEVCLMLFYFISFILFFL